MIHSIYIINRSKRKLDENFVSFFFIKGKYFSSRLKTFPFDIDIDSFIESELTSKKSSSNSIISILKSFFDSESALKSSSDSKDVDLIYHINRIIDIKRLYISLLFIKEILQLAHGNGYFNFQRCYEIVSTS